ncbi:putative clathrin assembly protein [Hordeum vulgare]|nr:putative clathrin assembly protein [Hordeum vulgare]
MSALQSWRKAYGALKDTTTVSLASLNSDFKDLDVAIVKATNHVECPPKDRHLRKIVAASSIARPQADVAYCIHALARRLTKTRSWIVALKTLVVIHRLLRDGDPTFREELLNFTQRVQILQLSNFKDNSSPIAWDYSSWVRTYGLFLEERLQCFRILKYDIEAERLPKQGQGPEKAHSQTRELDSQALLEQMPALQQLLYRLIGCRPEGAANNNYLVQYALALVLKESFKIYCAINDGIINLVDKFFEMPRHEALKALEIYRRAGQQAGNLSDFYENCRGLELARNFQFPTLREPPQTFLSTMEEYVKEAPRMVPIKDPLEFPERLLLTYKPEESEEVPEPVPVQEEVPQMEEPAPVPSLTEVPSSPPNTRVADTGDLLGLSDPNPSVSMIEESNALALAITPTGFHSSAIDFLQACRSFGQGGGFDKLTLDSLYDDGTYRQMQQQLPYGSVPHNPFMASDPFAVSNQIASPPSVQMAAMAQQPQQMQPNPFGPPSHPQHAGTMPVPNPFLDAGFGPFPAANGNGMYAQANPFGTAQLL